MKKSIINYKVKVSFASNNEIMKGQYVGAARHSEENLFSNRVKKTN